MRKGLIEAFNDSLTGTGTTYSPTRFNEVLGSFDKLAIQIVAEQPGGTTPTITVAMEHSNDQRNWVSKSTLTSGTAVSTSAPTVVVATDSGSTPTLAFVRFAVSMGGTSPACRMKILVCGRDDG